MTQAPPSIEPNDVLDMLKERINSDNKVNKEKITELEGEISRYKSIISTYEEKLKLYEPDKDNNTTPGTPGSEKNPKNAKIFKIQDQNINGLNLETEILTKEEQKFLRNILLDQENKLFETQLLYRFTRDGFTFESFHNKVDFISPLIIIVETQSGKKFGCTTYKFFKSLKFQSKSKEKEKSKNVLCFGFNTSLIRTVSDNIGYFNHKEEIKEYKKPTITNFYDVIYFTEEMFYFKNDMKNCYYSGNPTQLTGNMNYCGFENIFGKIDGKDPKEFEVKEIEVFTFRFE